MSRPRTADLDIGSAGDVAAHRPTVEMISDAWRRNAAPRPIVAWLMGDPPFEQSALAKKMGGLGRGV